MRTVRPFWFVQRLFVMVMPALLALHTQAAEPKVASPQTMGVADARHLLERASIGATPAEIASFSRLSRREGIEQVLKSAGTTENVPVPADVRSYVPRSEIRAQREMGEAGQKAVQREFVRRGLLLRGWWIEEMVQAQSPAGGLRERMVLFWHNHFVSSLAKVRSSALMYEQNQVFRTYALASFSDLLHAAAKSPAMLMYLDAANNRKGSPNENLAREVMELFTLGEGNYSEADVKEAARAYTGWSIEPETGAYKWRPALHDGGSKTVLGRTGNFDGDAVLDVLLQQPALAEFIVGKLWREFISAQPDMAEVRRIARVWREAGTRQGVPVYDVRVVLRLLFNSPAFWDEKNRGALLKSPVDLVLGTLRSFGMEHQEGLPFALVLQQLGQDLFAPPNVRGWPGGEAWINSSTLLLRKQFIERLLRSDDKRTQKSGDLKNSDMRAMDMDDGMGRARLQKALQAVHVDVNDWLRVCERNGLRPLQALMAVPVDDASGGAMDAREHVRQLMLDSAYQLR